MTLPTGGEDIKKCGWRGIPLQSAVQDKPGYLPEKAWDRDPVICQRCFRIKNYNEASSVAVDQDEFYGRWDRLAARMRLLFISWTSLILKGA